MASFVIPSMVADALGGIKTRRHHLAAQLDAFSRSRTSRAGREYIGCNGAARAGACARWCAPTTTSCKLSDRLLSMLRGHTIDIRGAWPLTLPRGPWPPVARPESGFVGSGNKRQPAELPEPTHFRRCTGRRTAHCLCDALNPSNNPGMRFVQHCLLLRGSEDDQAHPRANEDRR